MHEKRCSEMSVFVAYDEEARSVVYCDLVAAMQSLNQHADTESGG